MFFISDTQCHSPASKSRNHVSSPTIAVNKSIQPRTNILPSPTPSVLTVSSSLIQSEAIPITTTLQTLTTTAILQPLTRTVPVLLETTTSTEIKPSLESCLDSTEQLPTTPNFSLFSDINILTGKYFCSKMYLLSILFSNYFRNIIYGQ